MMWSSPGTSVWDWFSTSLMIVGFTMLLGLSVYLTMYLVHVEGAEPPDKVVERKPHTWRTDERIAS